MTTSQLHRGRIGLDTALAVATACGFVATAAQADPIHWWMMNGSVICEITGIPGVVHGNEAYTDGACPNSGQAFAFDGDTWIDSGHTIQLRADESMTFAHWVRLPSNAPNGWMETFGFERTNGHRIEASFRKDYSSGPSYDVTFQGDSSGVFDATRPYPYFDDQYHHFAIVRDGTLHTVSIYIDGVLDYSDVDPSGDINFNNPQPFGIGCQWHDVGPVSLFTGDLDDFRIYNTALTEQEIAELAQCGVGLAITGNCPGTMIMSASNLSPNESAVFLVSPTRGSFAIPNNYACAGTPLALSSRILLGMVAGADGNGDASPRVFVAPAACGYAVQVLDLHSCRTSNVDRF